MNWLVSFFTKINNDKTLNGEELDQKYNDCEDVSCQSIPAASVYNYKLCVGSKKLLYNFAIVIFSLALKVLS